jgi:hypothetical protein
MILQGMLPWKKKSWSHMAISYTYPDGSRTFFDVTGKGCKRHSEENFLKSYRLIDTHTLRQSRTFFAFNDWFKLLEGRDYDNLQIAGLLLKGLNLISFNMIGNNYKKLICSELIINYLAFFHKIKVKDSDNFDLIMTWNKVKEY